MKKIIYTLIIPFLIIQACCISNYIGYNGYGRDKAIQSTLGDTLQSKNRKIFINNLRFTVTNKEIDLDFYCYIEKTYRWGAFANPGQDKTRRPPKNFKYQYQISYPRYANNNKYTFKVNPLTTADSWDASVVFLMSPHIKDTVYLDVMNYNNKVVSQISIPPQ